MGSNNENQQRTVNSSREISSNVIVGSESVLGAQASESYKEKKEISKITSTVLSSLNNSTIERNNPLAQTQRERQDLVKIGDVQKPKPVVRSKRRG